MKRYFSLLLCAWLAVGMASAQTYVVDGLYRNKAKASKVLPDDGLRERVDVGKSKVKEKERMLPNGTEVTLLSDTAYRMVSVEYEGETWYMDSRELRFADSNPAGMEDVLADADFSPFPLTMTLKNGEQHPINRMEPGTAEWKVLHSRALPIALGVLSSKCGTWHAWGAKAIGGAACTTTPNGARGCAGYCSPSPWRRNGRLISFTTGGCAGQTPTAASAGVGGCCSPRWWPCW